MSFGGLDIVLWNDILDIQRPLVAAAGYDFLVDDPQWKVDRQAADWDTWIAQGNVKVIMGFPVQPDALVAVTKRANDAGIKVLGYTQNWPGTWGALLTNPLDDGKKLGGKAAEWIKQTYQDKPVEVCVLADRATDITRGRTDGIIAAVKEGAPNAVIDEVPALSRQEGFDGANRQLVAHPDTKVWLNLGDDAIQGAYRAVIDSGVKKDDPGYFFGSLDLTNASLDIVSIPGSIWRAGYVFTSRELAHADTDLMIDAATGKPPRNYTILPTLVTPENAKDFYVGQKAQGATASPTAAQ